MTSSDAYASCKGGGNLTFAKREYLDSLPVHYRRILEDSSRASRRAADSRLVLEETADIEYARALSQSRGRPPRIEQVSREDGTVSSEPSDIKGVFSDYFAALFSGQNISDYRGYEEDVDSFCGSLSQPPVEAYPAVIDPATLEEVRDALDAMNQFSAPGPDGCVAGFYAAFFFITGGLLLQLVNSFLGRGCKASDFRHGSHSPAVKGGYASVEPFILAPDYPP